MKVLSQSIPGTNEIPFEGGVIKIDGLTNLDPSYNDGFVAGLGTHWQVITNHDCDVSFGPLTVNTQAGAHGEYTIESDIEIVGRPFDLTVGFDLSQDIVDFDGRIIVSFMDSDGVLVAALEAHVDDVEGGQVVGVNLMGSGTALSFDYYVYGAAGAMRVVRIPSYGFYILVNSRGYWEPLEGFWQDNDELERIAGVRLTLGNSAHAKGQVVARCNAFHFSPILAPEPLGKEIGWPLCVSSDQNSAYFDLSSPHYPGEFPLTVYGTGSHLGERVDGATIRVLDCTLKESEVQFLVSPVAEIHTENAGKLVCRTEGVEDRQGNPNNGNLATHQKCFCDGSQGGNTPFYLVADNAGGASSGGSLGSEFLFESEEGVRYGQNFDFMPLHDTTSDIESLIEFGGIKILRSLDVSDTKRVYYGLTAPDQPESVSLDVYLVDKFNNYASDGGGGVIDNHVAYWNLFREDGTPVFSDGAMLFNLIISNLAPISDNTPLRSDDLPPGRYYIESFGAGLDVYVGNTKVVSTGAYNFWLAERRYFTIEDTRSQPVMYLWDRCANELVKIDVQQLYDVDSATNSIACVISDENNVSLICQRYAPNSFGNGSSSWAVIDVDLQSRETVGTSIIPLGRRLRAFDAVNKGGVVEVAASFYGEPEVFVNTEGIKGKHPWASQMSRESYPLVVYSLEFSEISNPNLWLSRPMATLRLASAIALYASGVSVRATGWENSDMDESPVFAQQIKLSYNEASEMITMAVIDSAGGWGTIFYGGGSHWQEVSVPLHFDAYDAITSASPIADRHLQGRNLGLASFAATEGYDGKIYSVASRNAPQSYDFRNLYSGGHELGVMEVMRDDMAAATSFIEHRTNRHDNPQVVRGYVQVCVNAGDRLFMRQSGGAFVAHRFLDVDTPFNYQLAKILTITNQDQHLVVCAGFDGCFRPIVFQNGNLDTKPFDSVLGSVFAAPTTHPGFDFSGLCISERSYLEVKAGLGGSRFFKVPLAAQPELTSDGGRFHMRVQIDNPGGVPGTWPLVMRVQQYVNIPAIPVEQYVQSEVWFNGQVLGCYVLTNGGLVHVGDLPLPSSPHPPDLSPIYDIYILHGFNATRLGAWVKFVAKLAEGGQQPSIDGSMVSDNRVTAASIGPKNLPLVDYNYGTQLYDLDIEYGWGDSTPYVESARIYSAGVGKLRSGAQRGPFEPSYLTDGDVDTGVNSIREPHPRFSPWRFSATDRTAWMYYPVGIKAAFATGAAVKDDRWRFDKIEMNRPSYVATSKLRGGWSSSTDQSRHIIWADAMDSGLDKFSIDSIVISGANFMRATLVARDTPQAFWRSIQHIDLTRFRLTRSSIYTNGNSVSLLPFGSEFSAGDFSEFGGYFDSEAGALKIVDVESESVLLESNGSHWPAVSPGRLFDTRGIWRLDRPFRYRYIGLLIEPYPTHEGFFKIEHFDFGEARSVPLLFNHNFSSGGIVLQECSTAVLDDGQSFVSGKKILRKKFSFEYDVVDRDTLDIYESMLQELSMNSKPVWVAEDAAHRPHEVYLCLIDADISSRVLVDERGLEYYSLTFSARSVG